MTSYLTGIRSHKFIVGGVLCMLTATFMLYNTWCWSSHYSHNAISVGVRYLRNGQGYQGAQQEIQKQLSTYELTLQTHHSSRNKNCMQLVAKGLAGMPMTTVGVKVGPPSIVILATSSATMAILLATYLTSMGITHHMIGVTGLPTQQYDQRGNGTALILVTPTPFGLPYEIPVVYLIPNPLHEALCISLKGTKTQPQRFDDVSDVIKEWDVEVADWLRFGRMHKAFTILSMDIPPKDFQAQMLKALGVEQVVTSESHTQWVLQAYNQVMSSLPPSEQEHVCSIFQQLQPVRNVQLGCYAHLCSSKTGVLAQIPCNTSYGKHADPLGSADTTTFEEQRHASLLTTSPRRFVVQKRRVCLITSAYGAKNSTRAKELHRVLAANVQNPYIDEVHVFVDPSDVNISFHNLWVSHKLVVIRRQRQLTHKDAIEYANKHLSGNIVMFSNADIVFTTSVHLVSSLVPGHLYALSRHVAATPPYFQAPDGYQPISNMCYHYVGSHDTFVYIPPIDSDIAAQVDHVQSLWGSENVVLYEFQRAGYKLSNPCQSIVTFHVHTVDDRAKNRPRVNKVRSGTASPTQIQTQGLQSLRCWTYSTQDGMLRDTSCR